MGRELWGSRSIGEQTQRQKEAVKSKKKVRNIDKIASNAHSTSETMFYIHFHNVIRNKVGFRRGDIVEGVLKF